MQGHSQAPAIIGRRLFLQGSLGSLALLAAGAPAAHGRPSFAHWLAHFRRRAHARGITDATYDRVMKGLKPDTSVYALDRAQPEFNEELWQYLNRRVSDWRVDLGRERVKENAQLLARIEHDTGVDRYIMIGLWGMELAFGEVVDNPTYMRPIFPALAALAWGEPRRRRYWERELLNAMVIVQRGWAKPDEMIGSWAGAMGHTQWMPEVWLHMGVDYDHDGRIFPFGKPDDALAGTARYLKERGHYRRGEPWGCEVRLPHSISTAGSPTTALGAAMPTGTGSALPVPTASRSRSRKSGHGCGCRSATDRRSCSDGISMPCIPTIRPMRTRWRWCISPTVFAAPRPSSSRSPAASARRPSPS